MSDNMIKESNDKMFEFNYNFDSKAVAASTKYLYGKYLRALRIFLPILFVANFLWDYYKSKDVTNLIAAGLFLVIWTVTSLLVRKFSAKQSIKNNKNYIGMTVNIIFNDSKIIAKTKKEGSFETSLEYNWKMISRIEQDDSYYFVALSKLRTYTIPKNSCVSGNESKFFSFVESKVKGGKNA